MKWLPLFLWCQTFFSITTKLQTFFWYYCKRWRLLLLRMCQNLAIKRTYYAYYYASRFWKKMFLPIIWQDICKLSSKLTSKTIRKKYSPTPGIEPGPPGWKPGILAIRPRGIDENIVVFRKYLLSVFSIFLYPCTSKIKKFKKERFQFAKFHFLTVLMRLKVDYVAGKLPKWKSFFQFLAMCRQVHLIVDSSNFCSRHEIFVLFQHVLQKLS